MPKKQREFYIEIAVLFFTLVIILGSLFTFSVFAENEIAEIIIADPVPVAEIKVPLLIEKDITLESSCQVQDTGGTTHIFPKADSPSKYLGICAIAEALKKSHVNDFKLANDQVLGLYIKSINSIEPNETQFWSLWKNGAFADCGIGCLSISEGDIISLILTDWATETESDKISLRITTLIPILENNEPAEQEQPQEKEQVEEETSGGSGNSSNHETPTTTFNTENALNYLKSVQSSDGSFANSSLYTDWAAIAFAAGNVTGSSRDSLIGYLRSHNTLSSLLTDNERRVMALLALEQNPYSFNGVNYIKAITESFDGTQFGDMDLVNDDIFALIPLKNSDFSKNDEIITKTIAFIISKQNSNGSWFESVDTTAAAVEALKSFESVKGAGESIAKASDYLIGKQNSDGSWENSIPSTSWAMQAESALGASWKKNGKSGMDFLAAKQKSAGNDGAVLPPSETIANRVWATSYAVSAASGQSWSDIMENVSKPDSSESTYQNNLSNSSTTTSDILETETIPDPAICPAGDLFNTTTGKPCTTFTEKESDHLPTRKQETRIMTSARTPLAETITSSKPHLVSKTPEEKTTPALTATSVMATPSSATESNVPLILASFASVILLFAGFKAFRK